MDNKIMFLGEVQGSTHSIKVEKDWFLEMVDSIVSSEIINQELLDNLQAVKAGTKNEILKRIFAGKEFMNIYFLKNPNVQSVAKKSYMSKFHFYRCFKQVIGITPYQYMLSKRLEHAKILLKDNALLISEIADECGFIDIFTFSKAFKKKYGFSPSKYHLKREAEFN